MTDQRLEGFKSDYPDLYGAIFAEGEKHAKGRPERMRNELGKLDKPKPDDGNLPVSERAKAAWDSDAALRVEFDSDFESWAAFFRANENGQVRILGQKRGAE